MLEQKPNPHPARQRAHPTPPPLSTSLTPLLTPHVRTTTSPLLHVNRPSSMLIPGGYATLYPPNPKPEASTSEQPSSQSAPGRRPELVAEHPVTLRYPHRLPPGLTSMNGALMRSSNPPSADTSRSTTGGGGGAVELVLPLERSRTAATIPVQAAPSRRHDGDMKRWSCPRANQRSRPSCNMTSLHPVFSRLAIESNMPYRRTFSHTISFVVWEVCDVAKPDLHGQAAIPEEDNAGSQPGDAPHSAAGRPCGSGSGISTSK